MKSRRSKGAQRPYLGVHYRCCNLYARAYLDATREAFVGTCPKCGRSIRMRVSPGGSSERFWSAQ